MKEEERRISEKRRIKMTTTEKYQYAKEAYGKTGVDTDAAIETLKKIPVSLHCWQGDDVTGFDLSLIHI